MSVHGTICSSLYMYCATARTRFSSDSWAPSTCSNSAHQRAQGETKKRLNPQPQQQLQPQPPLRSTAMPMAGYGALWRALKRRTTTLAPASRVPSGRWYLLASIHGRETYPAGKNCRGSDKKPAPSSQRHRNQDATKTQPANIRTVFFSDTQHLDPTPTPDEHWRKGPCEPPARRE